MQSCLEAELDFFSLASQMRNVSDRFGVLGEKSRALYPLAAMIGKFRVRTRPCLTFGSDISETTAWSLLVERLPA